MILQVIFTLSQPALGATAFCFSHHKQLDTRTKAGGLGTSYLATRELLAV